MPKLVEVVNFSVEHYCGGSIFIEYRLVAAAEVDDA
jgi:hypothetical protein